MTVSEWVLPHTLLTIRQLERCNVKYSIQICSDRPLPPANITYAHTELFYKIKHTTDLLNALYAC